MAFCTNCGAGNHDAMALLALGEDDEALALYEAKGNVAALGTARARARG